MTRKLSFVMIAFLIAAPVLAQQEQGLTAKIYEIKYRDANAIAQLLTSLDVELGRNSVNQTFNTLTVRANEQGHATVADLIRKYDVPSKTIEFQFFLIEANATGGDLKDEVPLQVQKALKDVASLTRYKGFLLIDAPLLRTQEIKPQARPSVGMKGKGIYNYVITISDAAITGEGKRQIRIGGFNIVFTRPMADSLPPEAPSSGIAAAKAASQNYAAELSTPFSINEGEIVVIGASQVESKKPGAAIITIVTAKII